MSIFGDRRFEVESLAVQLPTAKYVARLCGRRIGFGHKRAVCHFDRTPCAFRKRAAIGIEGDYEDLLVVSNHDGTSVVQVRELNVLQIHLDGPGFDLSAFTVPIQVQRPGERRGLFFSRQSISQGLSYLFRCHRQPEAEPVVALHVILEGIPGSAVEAVLSIAYVIRVDRLRCVDAHTDPGCLNGTTIRRRIGQLDVAEGDDFAFRIDDKAVVCTVVKADIEGFHAPCFALR